MTYLQTLYKTINMNIQQFSKLLYIQWQKFSIELLVITKLVMLHIICIILYYRQQPLQLN